MRANGVVVPPPFLYHDPRLGPTPEPFHRQTFVAKFALKLSFKPFCHGLPGSISARSRDSRAAHLSSAFNTNSGPLSERRLRGAPRSLIRRDSTSITRPDLMLPATSIARHSRVYSSTTVRHLIC